MRKLQTIVWVIAVLFTNNCRASETKRVMTAEDVVAIKSVSDPQISPDGTNVVFAVSKVDRKANEFSSDLWIVATAGGEPRHLTTSLKNDTTPRWSPDGTWIAFLSNRQAKRSREDDHSLQKNQIWLISVMGGEAQLLTNRHQRLLVFAGEIAEVGCR